jgi:hypothetical protein
MGSIGKHQVLHRAQLPEPLYEYPPAGDTHCGE